MVIWNEDKKEDTRADDLLNRIFDNSDFNCKKNKEIKEDTRVDDLLDSIFDNSDKRR